MGEAGKLVAPWSDEQVAALNAWQERGEVHPFTCGNGCDGVLIANNGGWYCIHCDYVQDWAHAFMAEPL